MCWYCTERKWSEDGMFVSVLMYCVSVFGQNFNSWKWSNPSVRVSCFPISTIISGRSGSVSAEMFRSRLKTCCVVGGPFWRGPWRGPSPSFFLLLEFFFPDKFTTKISFSTPPGSPLQQQLCRITQLLQSHTCGVHDCFGVGDVICWGVPTQPGMPTQPRQFYLELWWRAWRIGCAV